MSMAWSIPHLCQLTGFQYKDIFTLFITASLHHFSSLHDLGLKSSKVQLTIDSQGEIIRFSCETKEAFFDLF
jgi:hypothetical protein